MKNIEIKAKCDSLLNLKTIILQNGGAFIESMEQVDTYFTIPNGRLKLREIQGKSSYLIFYKRENLSQSKESNFFTYDTDNPNSLKDILVKALGIKQIVRKTRELYIYKNTRIHLDTVDKLGTFVELETMVTTQADKEAFKENEEIIKLLQIRKEDMLTGSYGEMVK